MSHQPESILVVDDNPTNLGFLCETLEQMGYYVRVAASGLAALESVHAAAPDLILLDIQMPEMDGIEVCRRLKADPQTQEIPVIFLTALSGSADEARGLDLGAADYITKPIQVDVVLSRIKTQLTIRRLYRTLHERNAALEAYASMVSHDLKNPLTAILTTASYLSRHISKLPPEMVSAYLGVIEQAGRRAVDIIHELLLNARTLPEEITTQRLIMHEIIKRVYDQITLLVSAHQGELLTPEQWPAVMGVPRLVELVWVNLISNALKYGGHPPLVELGAVAQADGMARFWVRDNGQGLSAEQQAQIFDQGHRLEAGRAEGHGLGLAGVKRIITRLGGQVGVESSPGAGSTFYFTLPLAPVSSADLAAD